MSEPENQITDQLIDIASGALPAPVEIDERRAKDRQSYQSLIGLIFANDDGTLADPLVLRAKNISLGGLCLVSRELIAEGRQGVLQLVRSNGKLALAGVEVRYCKYVFDLEHEVGLQFVPMPEGLKTEDFLDENGRVKLFDQLLLGNIESGPATGTSGTSGTS